MKETKLKEIQDGVKTILGGVFPGIINDMPVLFETIRDPDDPSRLAFLALENGEESIVPYIEVDGQYYSPPEIVSSTLPVPTFPLEVLPCGEPAELLAEISSTISTFITLRPELALIAASFVLASWFHDCLEAAPYLWIIGPPGSGKTKLLRLLSCLCRRGLLVGDLRSGSLYPLTDTWEPTLIIDELELGHPGANRELLRILRTGSAPGVPTLRNRDGFSTYCPKVIASRQLPEDTALLSRGVIVNLLPTEEDLPRLDEEVMQELAMEFQPKLLMFRLKNFDAIKKFSPPSNALQGLTARAKQIARALLMPLLGNVEISQTLLGILREHDEAAQIERLLEPEWLLVGILLDICHEESNSAPVLSEIFVGAIADKVNGVLGQLGESRRFSARKIGNILRSLELPPETLGRMGRGLRLTISLKRKIHGLARRLRIDRRIIAPATKLNQDCDEAPCQLCQEFGVTGGLQFAEKPAAQQ